MSDHYRDCTIKFVEFFNDLSSCRSVTRLVTKSYSRFKYSQRVSDILHYYSYVQNSPHYIATSDFEKELELQYRVHSALDVVEEKCSPGLKPTQDSRDLYLGLLYSTETHKIYGYVTNTKIKLIIVIDSNSVLRENEVRSMFRNLHVLYTDAVCNPFYTPGEPLDSKTFDKSVRSIMAGNA